MKYLVSGMVDDATLSAVVKAFGGPITLSALPAVQADAPFPTAQSQSAQQTEALKAAPAKPRAKAKRTMKSNGGEWPAKDSIYDVVLEAIKEGPKTPIALRDVLSARGFSKGSVNSALGRLDKAGKAKRGPEGWIVA